MMRATGNEMRPSSEKPYDKCKKNRCQDPDAHAPERYERGSRRGRMRRTVVVPCIL